MRNIILPSLIAATAFAGFMGAQIANSASDAPVQATTPANADKASPLGSAQFGDPQVSPNPVVIELFTSQGCSSCPPADMLASRLAKDSSLLVISRPVTYWDRLGWTDTLARESNTRLQRTYASKGRTGSGVYTPQIVVNGGGGAVGSREADVRSLVRLAKGHNGPSIAAEKQQDGSVTLRIDGRSRYLAGISLLALSSSETVQIGRGENGGRKLHYTNVVKDERNLGSWTGEPMQITIPQENLRITGADKYAVIVQRPGGGAIVAGQLLDI